MKKKIAPVEEHPAEQPVQAAALQFTPMATAPVAQPSMPAPMSVNGMAEIAEKLDLIHGILHRAERRERMRVFGSTMKTLIWLFLVVGSTWYLYAYGDQIMAMIAEKTAESAAKVAEQSSQSLMEQMQKQVPEDLLKQLQGR